MAAALVSPQPAWAGGQTSAIGASNTGQSVSVHASEASTSAGGGGGSHSRGRSTPAVDHRARLASLQSAMAREMLRETDRRQAEASAHRRLIQTRDRCADLADHYHALATQRVQVQRQVAEFITYATWRWEAYHETVWQRYQAWERVPVRQWYRERVRRGWRWITVWHSRVVWTTRQVWAARPVTVTRYRLVPTFHRRIVWHTITVWETRHNPAAAAVAAVHRACAGHYAAAVAAHAREVSSRRAAWDAHWAGLNRAAHEAWRAVNTTCRTVREVGDTDVQQCSYGEWRNYSPGSFERTIVVPPAPPPRQLLHAARDQVTPPGPVIRMSPRVEWEQIVHLPTWMWIDPGAWRPESARAQAGRAWAEATATPTRVVWDMGNGDRVVCEGPGAAYDEGRHETQQRTGCSYTYGQSSAGQPNDAYTVTATLVYDVTWHGSGDAGGDLGTIATSSSVPVRVAELQALVDWFG